MVYQLSGNKHELQTKLHIMRTALTILRSRLDIHMKKSCLGQAASKYVHDKSQMRSFEEYEHDGLMHHVLVVISRNYSYSCIDGERTRTKGSRKHMEGIVCV